MRRVCALIVCFAVAAHADVKRKRVPVKVVEIAGGRAYLEPGDVAGLRRGQDVKFGGDAYRVVDTTSKHAAVDNPRGKLRVGDTGEATVALGDEPGSRAAPAPLSRFTAQWKDAVPPATRQKPKVVPLGPTGREGPVSLSLVEHGMVILPSAGGTVVAGELGARLSFEPWRDPLIGIDADASALLWAGDGLAGDSASRPPVRVRELRLRWGDRRDPWVSVGRLRWAAATVGALDGGRVAAPIGGGVSVAAFGGLVPDAVTGRPSTAVARFGGEVALDLPRADMHPRATLTALGSTFDGSVDERRLIATVAGYLAWAEWDRRHTRRVSAVAADVAALGDDAVPTSIHPVIDPDVCIGSGACVRACPEKDVLGMIDGRAHLVNPLACNGHGACMSACPVHAIKLVFGTATRGVDLPALGPDFQTSRPGVYVVGELAGMGLIRNAVEQGRQAAGYLRAAGRRGPGGDLDAIVVGAGPAGIAATLTLRESGLRVLLLEQDQFGGTVRHYPRGKVVMTGAIDLPGFGRLRRKTMSKEQLGRVWDDVLATTQLPVETGVRVDALNAQGDLWAVVAGERVWRAANVVLALGRRGSPRRLGVPGEDQPHVHYRLLEPEPFAGKRVLVVGGGNAAAECALALADAGTCAAVGLSYRRAQLARLRGQVRERLDAAFAAGRVAPHLETEVESIGKSDVTLRRANGTRERLLTDAVIVQIGGTPPGDLLSRLGIATVTKMGQA